MLFSLAIQPLLLQLHEGKTDQGLQLAYSYLDDLILAGEQRVVSEAFFFFKRVASQIGLEFNIAKCEVIPAAGALSNLEKDLFRENITFREDGSFELLDGPIESKEFCKKHTQTAVNMLNAKYLTF